MLSFDDAGLPVFSWDESNSMQKCTRTCFLAEGQDGALQFVHERGATTGWQGHAWMVGLAVLAGAFAAMSGVAVVHDNFLGYKTMTPASLALLLLATATGAVLAGRATYRYFAARETAQWAAPWHELKAFVVTDNQTFLGTPRRHQSPLGGSIHPVDPVPVIFADFGDAARPVVISGFNYTQQALMELRGHLSREFIDRRREHLERLARERRDAQNAETGERRKVV